MRVKVALVIVCVVCVAAWGTEGGSRTARTTARTGIAWTEAAPMPFVSPVPWCAPNVPQPCLPWRPLPPKDKPQMDRLERYGYLFH